MKQLMAILSAALMLAGCATDAGMRDEQRLALYQAHAGAPVDSFHYFGSFDGWTPLGDSAVAVWARPTKAYLLQLAGPCPDLEFASAIGVSSSLGYVHARFDKVTPLRTASTSIPCHIKEIRPLDVKAIKQAERDKRAMDQASGET